jgi:hypothetical protein
MPEFVSTIGLFVGYTMLNAAARSGTAVSNEAREVQRSASIVAHQTEQSVALFGEKRSVISQIWSLAAECSETGWDGEGAKPIDEVAATLASDFVRALPDRSPLPEVSPEPDGALSFDWIESRHRLFSLSIGTSNRLAYAWIDGAERGHGVAVFDGENIPLRILQGVAEICKHNVTLRAA